MPKPIAIPMPELFARCTGKIQFTCPNCGQEHPFKHIQWRRADYRCDRCKSLYQVGLGFSYSAGPQAYLMGKSNKFTVNRLNPVGTAYDGIKLHGDIEWDCPNCDRTQVTFFCPESRIECESCAKPYFVSALVYRFPGYKTTLKAPMDSVVKGLHHVREVTKPIPVETPSESSRVAGEIPSGDL